MADLTDMERLHTVIGMTEASIKHLAEQAKKACVSCDVCCDIVILQTVFEELVKDLQKVTDGEAEPVERNV